MVWWFNCTVIMINRLTWIWLKKEELEETFLAQRSQSRLGSRRNCNTELQPQKTGPKYSKNLQGGKKVCYQSIQHAANIGLLILYNTGAIWTYPGVLLLIHLHWLSSLLLNLQIRELLIIHICHLGVAHTGTSRE